MKLEANKIIFSHEYEESRKEITQVQKEVKNEEGKVEKVTEKSEETVTDIYQVVLRKPPRRMREESQFFFSKRINFYISEGILPASIVQKKILDGGGAFSKDEIDQFQKMFEELNDRIIELTKLKAEPESEQDNVRIKEVNSRIAAIKSALVDFERVQNEALNHTAERLAQQDLILWALLNCAYWRKNDEEDFKPVYNGDSFEQKKSALYEMDDNEEKLHVEAQKALVQPIAFMVMADAYDSDDLKSLMEGIKELYPEEADEQSDA